MNWVDHRRAIASLLAYLTRPHAAGELRVHAAGAKLLSSYEEMSRQTEAEQRRLAGAQASTDLVAGAFAGVASLACYGVLWWLLATGGLPLAVGGTAVIAIRTSTARLTSLVQQVNRLYEELLFLTDTEDAIKVAGENAIPLTGAPLPAPVREVRTEAVSFTYPGADGPSLKGVSVRVPRGKVTALVGANGSGKTTLTKVLAGLLLPSEGNVWWVGESGERVELREANRAQVFAEVGLLAQDFPRWEMTAAANVAIGAGDRPRDMVRVREAADEAGVLALVEGLPHGWDSIVFKGYERGVQLSGGQWQKLGSARSRPETTSRFRMDIRLLDGLDEPKYLFRAVKPMVPVDGRGVVSVRLKERPKFYKRVADGAGAHLEESCDRRPGGNLAHSKDRGKNSTLIGDLPVASNCAWVLFQFGTPSFAPNLLKAGLVLNGQTGSNGIEFITAHAGDGRMAQCF
ncbi:ABC transporter ATP-binding protein [Streptomyces diastatochromogenes]|nr:ABC transporter ATP-binding protein [Streptomyces diastatochromogenes]